MRQNRGHPSPRPSRRTARAASARVFCKTSEARTVRIPGKHSRFGGLIVVRLLDLTMEVMGAAGFQPDRKTFTIHGRSEIDRRNPG
jgi:hypothetical protein